MTIEDQIAKLAELREATREANQVLKDLRAERKAVVAEFGSGVEEIVRGLNERIGAEVAKGLNDYSDSLDKAIKDATQRIYDRFDLIAAICLGKDYESKKAGSAPIEELIRRYIKLNGSPV